jgi:hypothetical protein
MLRATARVIKLLENLVVVIETYEEVVGGGYCRTLWNMWWLRSVPRFGRRFSVDTGTPPKKLTHG